MLCTALNFLSDPLTEEEIQKVGGLCGRREGRRERGGRGRGKDGEVKRGECVCVFACECVCVRCVRACIEISANLSCSVGECVRCVRV